MVNVDRIRSMANLPLDSKGLAEAQRVASRLGERGGVLGVSSSPLTRAIQTASAVLAKCPTARLLDVTSCLEPWHLGEFEGERSDIVHAMLVPYIENPDRRVPGIGASSKVPGEALDDYLERFLPYLYKQTMANPEGYGLVLTCHYRNIKAAKAWVAAGAKTDWSIDPKVFLEKEEDSDPGALWCVEREKGKWIVEPEDLFGEDGALDDVYLLRHGSTDWNSNATHSRPSAGS